MSNEQQNDWVHARTPHDDDLGDDNLDQDSEYGQAFEPEEWDDYASEQSAPVAPPQPRPEPEVADQPADEQFVAAEETTEPEPYLSGPVDEPELQPEAEMEATVETDLPPLEPESPADPIAEPAAFEEPVVSDEPGYETPSYGGVAGDPEEPIAEVDATPARGNEPEEVEPEVSEPEVADGDEPVEDPDATRAIPVAVFPDEAALSGAVPPRESSVESQEDDALGQVFRSSPGEPATEQTEQTEQIDQVDGAAEVQTTDETQVLAPAPDYPEVDEQEAEEQRIQAQLAAERQARQERLGVVETSEANATRGAQAKPKRTTDKFAGAFPMFLLRLITAAVVGITGYQMLTPVQDTAAIFESTILPEPELMSWILGFTLATLAVLLVLGLLQRVVGFLLMVYSIGLLAILRWGPFNPFREAFEGFVGDKELLLAGIGFLLLMVGGGSWGIDGAFRASRAKAKAERQA